MLSDFELIILTILMLSSVYILTAIMYIRSRYKEPIHLKDRFRDASLDQRDMQVHESLTSKQTLQESMQIAKETLSDKGIELEREDKASEKLTSIQKDIETMIKQEEEGVKKDVKGLHDDVDIEIVEPYEEDSSKYQPMDRSISDFFLENLASLRDEIDNLRKILKMSDKSNP